MPHRFRSERLTESSKGVPNELLSECRINMHKMYHACRKQGLAMYNTELDYADFIHGLWRAMLKHQELQKSAEKIEQTLGLGDTIQLLSDVVLEQQSK